MKASKVARKQLNAMRGMGDVPWPARRFRYPPSFGVVVTDAEKLVKHGRRRARREREYVRELEARGQAAQLQRDQRKLVSRVRRLFQRRAG